MTTRKPGIPSVSMLPAELVRVLAPMKENIELINGVRGGTVAQLDTAASTADIIAKINEIITRINSTGA